MVMVKLVTSNQKGLPLNYLLNITKHSFFYALYFNFVPCFNYSSNLIKMFLLSVKTEFYSSTPLLWCTKVGGMYKIIWSVLYYSNILSVAPKLDNYASQLKLVNQSICTQRSKLLINILSRKCKIRDQRATLRYTAT